MMLQEDDLKMALQTEGLSIGYKGKSMLSGLNLLLRPGRVTAMIGRNGAGKSTLIKTLTGHIPPFEGEIFIRGRRIAEINRRELSNEMALVTTEPNMAGGLRLEEMVGLGRIPFTGKIGWLTKKDREIVKSALKDTGIYHKREKYVGELSDGERQKGLLARGLVQETPIIIMDEPFSFLDVASRLEIMQLMKRMAIKRNCAVLFSTHEVTEALKTADEVWLFVKDEKGERVVQGSPAALTDAGYMDRIFPDSKVEFVKDTCEFVYRN